jgi:DeoR/GlpR family transcriptional regulator of sugar metabolism
MYAHGLSLEQVQGHADVSVETVKSNLVKLEQQGLWDKLEEHILLNFPMVSKKSFDELLETVEESVRRKSAFQSRSAKLRREFKSKSIKEVADFWNEIEEMMIDDL